MVGVGAVERGVGAVERGVGAGERGVGAGERGDFPPVLVAFWFLGIVLVFTLLLNCTLVARPPCWNGGVVFAFGFQWWNI